MCLVIVFLVLGNACFFQCKAYLDAIKLMTSDDIIIEFNNELSPCCLRPSSDELYTYIVMPIEQVILNLGSINSRYVK